MERLLSLKGEHEARSTEALGPYSAGIDNHAWRNQTRCQDPVDGLRDPGNHHHGIILTNVYYEEKKSNSSVGS